jgi:hypothetical protein
LAWIANSLASVKCEDDHLEHVASSVWPDGQLLGRIGVGIEVDHHQRVIGGVTDVIVVDAVAASRAVDLHTRLV